MEIHGLCRLGEPRPVLAQLVDLDGCEEFDSVWRRIAKGLKQTRGYQKGDIVHLAI
jgi:hypothetical protein